jgi:glucarate dehydratase
VSKNVAKVISAFEVAMLDLQGQLAGAPIVDLLGGVLEYYEDPAPGLDGMAAIAQQGDVPLATNMVVTDYKEFAENVRLGCPVRIGLSDHHYWGGLHITQQLSRLCQTFDMDLSMHSNSHLGISLTAMTHLAASVPHLTYACDTHYPWQDDEVVQGGRLKFEIDSLGVPRTPGFGVTIDPTALARLHDNYLHCGIRNRDDLEQMRRYDPSFTGKQPRF